MTKEEILDLQAVLDLEQTGLLDEKTISRLDDYINQSKFASSDEAKKVIERNKKFGLSTEQTIDDIRELVIKSILEKIYKDDENKATRIIIEYVNNSLPKEADIVKTFMDYGQEELAKSYMSGGLLSFLRYDEGGKLQYKVGSAELVNKIMNNPEFYNAVLNSAFNGNEKRMRRFLEKSAKAGNFVKHTFNVEPNSFGQVQRSVKSDYVDWNPAEGVSDSFLNSGRKPNIFQRIFTGGENKVEKGLNAVATLVANNPEIAKLLESENSEPIEAESTSTQIETSTTENKQTEQNKQVEKDNTNTSTETSNTNSGSEGSNTKVVKQDEGKDKVIKRRVPIDNSAAIKAGEERSKLYNSWSAYPELQREYKLLWFEKGGAKADQAKIHEEILQELRKRGLIDANNQYIKKKSDNNNPPPEDEGRDIDYKRRSGDDPLPPENKAGEKNLKPYKVGEKITVNGKTYEYKGKMWEDGERIHNFIDEKGKPYFLTHDEYLERSTDFTPYNSDEGFTAKDLLTTTAGTVVGGLLGAFLGGRRRTGKVGNPLAKKKLSSGLKTKGKTPTKKTTPSNSSSTSTTTTSSNPVTSTTSTTSSSATSTTPFTPPITPSSNPATIVKRRGGKIYQEGGTYTYKDYLTKQYIENENRIQDILNQLEQHRKNNQKMYKEAPRLYGIYATNQDLKVDKPSWSGKYKVGVGDLRDEGYRLMERNRKIEKILKMKPKVETELLPSFKKGGMTNILLKKKVMI